MKKVTFSLLIILAVISISSCTTYRGNAGGGCQMNRNLVGYK